MDTKTCTKGHTMTGIGFDTCPECESPWKPREGGDKQCNRYNCPCNTGLSNSCPSEPEDEKCKCGYIEGRTYDHSDAMCNLCYGKVPYFPPKPEDEKCKMKEKHYCHLENCPNDYEMGQRQGFPNDKVF